MCTTFEDLFQDEHIYQTLDEAFQLDQELGIRHQKGSISDQGLIHKSYHKIFPD